MPHLIFINPEFLNQKCQLPNGTFSVGRSKGNDIVIRADSVSQNHCELLVYGPEVIVREKGSKNGTFVSEVRVNAQKGVRHGDCLRLGKVKIRLELECEEHENTTALSAIDEFRKFQESEKQPKPEEQKFPVIFKPTQINLEPAEETASIPPPLTADNEIIESEKTQKPRSLRSNMGLNWKWLAAGLAAAVLAYFIWK